MAEPRSNWTLIFTLWAAGLGAAAQFGKISVTFDLLTTRFGGGIALMVSVVGLIGLIFGMTAGLIVQRLGYRQVLIAALLLGAAMSLLQVAPLSYGLMMASRIVEGLSHLGIVVCAPVLIARAARPADMSAAMSLWSSFFGLSFALTAWLGLPLAAAYGEGALFAVHSLYMGVLAVLLWRMAPNIGRQPMPLSGLLARHLGVYRSPFMAAPALGFVFYTAQYVALLTLLPLAVGGAQGAWLGFGMPLISIAVSLTIGVALLQKFDPVRLVQAGFAVAALAGLWLVAVWGGAVLWPGLLLAAALGLVQGSSFAAIPALNASDTARSGAAGAIAQLGNLGTTTGTPLLALMMAGNAGLGLLGFVLPLSLGGIVVSEWLRRRRQMPAYQS